MKVVFISSFTAYNKKNPFYLPGTDGFFSFGMGQFIAKEFIRRKFNIDFEIWRSDQRIKEPTERIVEQIYCRIFPGYRLPRIGEFSFSLLHRLIIEAKSCDTVFHFMPNHNIVFHLYAMFLRKRRVISTHIGGANPRWNFHHTGSVYSYINMTLEHYLWLRSYSCTITICSEEAAYYEAFRRPVLQMPILGIANIDKFYIRDRVESRKELGWPLDKKILLQVGRATLSRGFDWIVKLLDHYQDREGYLIVFVGISEMDEYYSKVVERNVVVYPYTDQAILSTYYNAADLLFYLPHDEMNLTFAGTSYVPIEALSCGTPVIATTLHHIPDERTAQISRNPSCFDDVPTMIEDLLSSPLSRELCRSIALQYFSWDAVLEKHLKCYLGLNTRDDSEVIL